MASLRHLLLPIYEGYNCSELSVSDQEVFKLCAGLTRWLLRGGNTRPHSELGREDPQRRWYCILRCGRVGHCRVCRAHNLKTRDSLLRNGKGFFGAGDGSFCFLDKALILGLYKIDAGWSSPVARQAHNLKVVGSNPTPATKAGSQKPAPSPK